MPEIRFNKNLRKIHANIPVKVKEGKVDIAKTKESEGDLVLEVSVSHSAQNGNYRLAIQPLRLKHENGLVIRTYMGFSGTGQNIKAARFSEKKLFGYFNSIKESAFYTNVMRQLLEKYSVAEGYEDWIPESLRSNLEATTNSE